MKPVSSSSALRLGQLDTWYLARKLSILGGALERRRDRVEIFRGMLLPCFSCQIDRRKNRERERDGALALGGRRLAEKCSNQIIVGVSGGGGTIGETQPGRNVWGGCHGIVWPSN